MRILVAGWFSFEHMGVTAGDIIAKDVVSDWLQEAGIDFDVALIQQFEGGVLWQNENPKKYTDVLFVCGPFGNGPPIVDFLNFFSNARFIGLNLSMLQNLKEWNPFDLLIERDSSRTTNPDITFSGRPSVVPVVGIILAHKQKEYGKRALHDKANEVIELFISTNELAVVRIDTALEENKFGLKTPGEIEALIARMDIIITTRLHGTVLALKNAVPVIAIDPIRGGAKITKQVNGIDWPVILQSEDLDNNAIEKAFQYCLSEDAKTTAMQCFLPAIAQIKIIEDNLKNYLLRKKNS